MIVKQEILDKWQSTGLLEGKVDKHLMSNIL